MRSSSVRSNSIATSSYNARPTNNDQDTLKKDGVVRTLSRSSVSSAGTISSQRTLAEIRTQVAQEVAIRAITKAEVIGDSEPAAACFCLRNLYQFSPVKVGVIFTLSKNDDEQFLSQVTATIEHT